AKDIAIDLIFGDENDRKLIREKEEEIQADEKEKYQILNTQLNEQYCFVQFHQSYDYTDFVEGLRPKDDGKGNIVFERKDGVFKEFCKKAIGAHFSNFEPAYKKFIEDLNKNNGIKLQTLKQKKSFSVRVNSNGNLYATPDTKAATDMPVTKELLKVYVETGEIKDWKPYVTAIGEYLKENYSLGDLSIDDSQKEKKYIFIIDETNRGEMSKIFGELFYSIDPGYRGIKGRIKTQYQNLIDDKHDVFVDGFYVPENVYIIGTMNDIDRSVESMDFAMRRRFAFKEITAAQSQESMFGDDEKWKKSTKKEIKPELLDRLKKRMDYLNEKILDPKYHLGQAYQIGGAYFLKFAKYYDESKKNELDAFNKLWENHIACVVKEYLRGIDDRENTLFEELKQAYQADSGINATVPAKDDDENASNAGTGAGGGN
ncbi:MAG: AAA family ATPase, partial [Fibrobacter sp.]|uniref:AAA family ATPase n=1 Tax=Fibrobacter sp. TaxID=35828 RepID=UPI002A910482